MAVADMLLMIMGWLVAAELMRLNVKLQEVIMLEKGEYAVPYVTAFPKLSVCGNWTSTV
jgi:hypothetical protein